jgi:acetolactate synthase-1/2/3 large subunit
MTMIKVSDFVIKFLVAKGIHDIFLVSGGGIMHLLDSVGQNENMNYYSNYHEQACAISAEGYARITNGVGACLVTVGPGGGNALSGMLGAWYDSIPTIIICGQVRRDLIADYSKVRQIGPQEGNNLAMVKPVTKYAAAVLDPHMIKYELELAFYKATSGRPGPVWLDIPLDVQDSQVDESQLRGFTPEDLEITGSRAQLKSDVKAVIDLLKTAKRPIFLCGNGIHLSKSEELLGKLLKKVQVPVVLPDTAKDLVAEDYPLYMGIFGTAGQRRANFAVQNSDCVLSLAAGLCLKKVGFNYKGFAPKAKKIIVDIDAGQLHDQVLKPDLAVEADIHIFLEELLSQLEDVSLNPSTKWLDACVKWKQRYPLIVDDYYLDTEHVNSYVFIDRLSDALSRSDILVAGNGLDTVSYIQVFKVKEGQRTLTSGNWGAMGWDLPLAIGMCIGNGKHRTICVTGDGSLQWNVQELLTIRHYNLPIKIFVFNNRGYSSIRATQKTFFKGRFVGSEQGSGVSNPDFEKLAAAYGLEYACITNNDEIEQGITKVLSTNSPALCEVNISPEQGITPKASAFIREDGTIESRPLEDMAPFLPREEIWENMHLFDEDQPSM